MEREIAVSELPRIVTSDVPKTALEEPDSTGTPRLLIVLVLQGPLPMFCLV